MAKQQRKGKKVTVPGSTKTRTFWDYLLPGFCIVLIVINIFLIISVFGQSGWDYQVYTGTVQAMMHGENPYIMANVDKYSHLEGFPFPYPPHAIAFFFALHVLLPDDHSYYLLWTLFVIVSGLVILYAIRTDLPAVRPINPLILYTVIICGFLGVFWTYLTGNIAILYLLLFSLIFCLIVKKRYELSAVVLGITASFTLFPLLFSLAYLGIRNTWKQRIILVAISGITLTGVIGITALVDPGMFSAYLEQTFHGPNSLMEGSQSSTEGAYYIFNPTAYWFFNQFLKLFGLQDTLLYPLLSVLFVFALLAGLYVFIKRNRERELEIYSLAIVAIFMIIPRLKPYNFVFALIPFYFLVKDYPAREQCLALTVTCFLPLAFFLVYPSYPGIWTAFGQFFSLVLGYMLVIWYGIHPPGEQNPTGPAPGAKRSGS